MNALSSEPFSDSVWSITLALFRQLRQAPSWQRKLIEDAFPKEEAFADQVEVEGFAEAWRIVKPHTMLDVFRLASVAHLFEASHHLPGDVFECGVAAGGTSLMLALLMKKRKSDKKLWMFDSFKGLPKPDRAHDRGYEEGEFAHPLPRVRALLEKHGVADICLMREGWLSDTLPQLKDESFCFGHVDVDLYHPAHECITHLYPRLHAGAALIFDDYYDGSEGVFKAVNEAFLERGETILVGPSPQCAIVKKSQPANRSVLRNHAVQNAKGELMVSFDHLRKMPYYSDFLDGVVAATKSLRAGLFMMFQPDAKRFRSQSFESSIRAFQRLMRDSASAHAADLDLLGSRAWLEAQKNGSGASEG